LEFIIYNKKQEGYHAMIIIPSNIYKRIGCLTFLYVIYLLLGILLLLSFINNKNEQLITISVSFSGILLIVSSIGAILKRKWGVATILVVHLGFILNAIINRAGISIILILLSSLILIGLVRPYYNKYK
jgi:hypothetical protein